MLERHLGAALLASLCSLYATAAPPVEIGRIHEAMRRATDYFVTHTSLRGGYVYYYSPDLQTRYGEGLATESQIWVQPPGTPTVGMALIAAHQATGEQRYLVAATEAGEALLAGQLESGGWQNHVDFAAGGSRAHRYRGRRKGRNYSTLDDGITQNALRFLIQLDKAHHFQHQAVHEATAYALQRLLAAQFPIGAFPQVWEGPVAEQPIATAKLPDYDWRTENRVKEYWDFYTLNDNLASEVTATLHEAYLTYGDTAYYRAIIKLGTFLVRAQLPQPQPAWAQQYNFEMVPVWARAFEPPAVASSESQDVIDTLLTIYQLTDDRRFLRPISTALDYLEESKLADGRLARYYELHTNRPLYMQRAGDRYELTHRDTRLPSHYGWKIDSRLPELRARYQQAIEGAALATLSVSADKVRTILEELDDQGRWLSTYDGERLTGQPKFKEGEAYLSSAVFAENLTTLARYLQSQRRY